MPPMENGILENGGYWEELNGDSPSAAKYFRLSKVLDIVKPSFFTKTSGPRKPLGRTAYLDGLRGFAAFLVYILHHELWAHDSLNANKIFENAFGYNNQYYFVCLPWIRTFFSGGHLAVTTFFVISGYVLSRKPLTLIQANDQVKASENLTSALFRRWMRLYIPVIVTTFCYMTSWHAFGLWTDTEQQSNYRDELWKWYTEFKNFSFIFRSGGDPWFTYNVHTWSIAVEMRGSIVIYTALMAFSRCARNARLWCEVGLMFYFMYIVDGSHCAMFMAGMFLCDLDLLADNDDLPDFFTRFEPYKDTIFSTMFIVALYLGGVPSHSNEYDVLQASPGWYYLSFLKPQAVYDYKWFFLFWASIFIVACIPRINWLKRFFETRFCQYMGRISFAFYLVHGPTLFILGDRLYTAVGWSKMGLGKHLESWVGLFPLSDAGPLGLELRFFPPHLILLPVTLWLAEIVTKLVDEPSVKFAQWFYRKTLAPANTKA